MKLTKLIFIVIAVIIFSCTGAIAIEEEYNETIETPIEEFGEVIKVIDESIDKTLEAFGENQKVQKVKVKILSGELSGKEIIIENRLSGNPGYDIDVKAGNKVILNIEKMDNGETDINISNYYRFPALIILSCIFALSILIFGGKKGVKAIIALVFTYFLLFYFLIPMILNGASPLLITIIISIAATCFTIFIISGMNLKSLSAIIGTAGGVTAAGLIALITIKTTPLSGTPSQEAIMLWTSNNALDFKGILASAMIIGALGASMDVGISIASSIFEVKKANPKTTTMELITAGMNVGKDIMGTMTNTLLLAYTGSALFLLLVAYNNVSIIKLLNLDSIVTEITAALAGSIGLILCIPLTAITAGYLLNIKKTEVININKTE